MVQFNSQEKQAIHQAVQNLIGSDGTMSPRNLKQTDRLFVYVIEKWTEWLAHANNISTVSHKMLVKVRVWLRYKALQFVPELNLTTEKEREGGNNSHYALKMKSAKLKTCAMCHMINK